jgi:transposase-like protein
MIKFSRLSSYKVRRIILCFCKDITTNSASKLLNINRNTASLYYNYFRDLIFQQSFQENARNCGIFELDESYFRARRVR